MNEPAPDAPSGEDDALRLAIEQTFGVGAMDFLDDLPTEVALEAASSGALGHVPSLDALIARIDAEHAPLRLSSMPGSMAAPRRVSHAADSRYIVFSLAATDFAVPLKDVLEIQKLPRITPIPNVPTWVLGVTNLRGDILSVVDLRAFLGLAAPDPGRSALIMVARSSDQELTTALVVDRVPGMVGLDPDAITAPTSHLEGPMTAYMRGVAESRNRLLVVLDLDHLLHSREMRQFQQT